MGRPAKKKKEPKKNEPEPSQRTGKGATAKAKKKIKFPDLQKLFAPYQDSEDDVQVFWFDVLGGVRKYKIMMRLRKKRQRKLAPVLLGENNVPMTPCNNPVSGSSHHILRLTNSRVPGYMVDLLIRDSDLYITAFRRHCTGEELILSEEDLKASKIKLASGTWYIFTDSLGLGPMPKFVKNFSSMGIGSSHGNKKSIGGDIAFNEMFYSLARFQDGTTDQDALERAIANAIVAFCEASRFKSIYDLMISRMGNWDTPGSDLAEETWKRIRGWAVMGGYWLSCRLKGEIKADEALPKSYCAYKFDPMTMRSLMNELLLVKFDPDHLIDLGELEELQKQRDAAKNIKDPKFEAKEEEEEEEEEEEMEE